MFTKNTLAGLAVFFRIHSFAKAGPFVWTSQARIIVTLTDSKWHKLFQVLGFAWVLVNNLWTPMNFVRRLLHGAPVVTSVLNFMFLQFYFPLFLYRCNYFKNGDAIKGLANSMLHFNRKVSVMLLGSENPVKLDGCEVYVWAMVYSLVFNPVLSLVSLYARDPLNTRFLYHFVAPGHGKRTWSFWLWAVVEYFGVLCSYAPWTLILILIWTYSKSVTFWLRQMRFGKNARLTERPTDMIRLFRQLQILNILFNASFASVVTPVFVTQIMVMHVLTIFVTLRMHGAFPIVFYGLFAFWAVGWFVLEGLLYTMLGNVNYYSKRTVKSWTDSLGAKSRKRLRSMRPLGINLGSIYVIHRTTVMYMFLSVANFTVQTLLLL